MSLVETRDVIVIGGGVSGLAFAWHAMRAGKKPLVLEATSRLGGCLDSRRTESGYWFELGAHTLYNSYGALLEIAQASPAPPALVPRAEARKRFARLQDGGLDVMGPLSVLGRFSFLELLVHAPGALFGSKEGRSNREHFGRLVGPGNYARVLGPFLAAVPSQNVDAFPASGPGSLFKKRPRRKELPRSFTFEGGVGAWVEAVRNSGLEVAIDAPARRVRPAGGAFEVLLEDGRMLSAPVVALAVDVATALRLVRDDFSPLAAALQPFETVSVESLGVVVRREDVSSLPELAFVVPAHDDLFWSAVTRDPVPDPAHRAFTFHFRPGVERERKLRRISELLGVDASRFLSVAERTRVLPSPRVGHATRVAEIERAVQGSRLAVTGNYFAGMAIEDCVARSKAEWGRVSAL